jgi:hypothetical protein
MIGLAEYKHINVRQAALLRAGGKTAMGKPREIWPGSDDGPMTLVCQFNLTNAPVVPLLLHDVKLLSLFVNLKAGDWGEENGMDWVLRAYPSLDTLVPLAGTAGGMECRWSKVEDYPALDDPRRIVPEGFDDFGVDVESLQRTKIGGWSGNIESPPWWDLEEHPASPQYCFQVASDEKAGIEFGEGGILYLARGTAIGFESQWFLDWQSY